jgi:acetylornithine deacetylase
VLHYVEKLCACQGGDGVAYTTEAGVFHAAGIPCVVLGPGSIEQAHRPDEFIEESQLAACFDWLARLTAELCRVQVVA